MLAMYFIMHHAPVVFFVGEKRKKKKTPGFWFTVQCTVIASLANGKDDSVTRPVGNSHKDTHLTKKKLNIEAEKLY